MAINIPMISTNHELAFPYVFTGHGAIMVSSVLDSQRAIETNVLSVRAFVRLRVHLSTHKELLRKLEELENRVGEQDEVLGAIGSAIQYILGPKLGFPRTGFNADKRHG